MRACLNSTLGAGYTRLTGASLAVVMAQSHWQAERTGVWAVQPRVPRRIAQGQPESFPIGESGRFGMVFAEVSSPGPFAIRPRGHVLGQQVQLVGAVR
jgi:trehalose utilization protein